jgi:hypothetical protein
LKFFQVLEESAEAQEGAYQLSDQAEEKRSGPLVFHVQEVAEECMEQKGSELLVLGPITSQSLDLSRVVRELKSHTTY